jgi:hypothetical protein
MNWQRESNGLARHQPLPPVIEGLIAEAVLATERTHRQLALLLLPDQFLPFLSEVRRGLWFSYIPLSGLPAFTRQRGSPDAYNFMNH